MAVFSADVVNGVASYFVCIPPPRPDHPRKKLRWRGQSIQMDLPEKVTVAAQLLVRGVVASEHMVQNSHTMDTELCYAEKTWVLYL